jgi:hypothetical protein
MKTEECREWREQIGALVLGQLPDDERFAVEAHLEGCATCRAEAEALSPVAAMLERVDPARLVASPEPPPELGERIARQIAAERWSRRRRRTRLRLGLATTGAAAIAAAVLLIVGLGGSSKTAPSETVAFRSLPHGAWAEAELTPHAWGSEISVQVGGFPPGMRCSVWLRRDDGERVPAGSFRYVYRGGGQHTELSAAVKLERAAAIGMQVGDRTYVAPLPHRSTATALAAPGARDLRG